MQMKTRAMPHQICAKIISKYHHRTKIPEPPIGGSRKPIGGSRKPIGGWSHQKIGGSRKPIGGWSHQKIGGSRKPMISLFNPLNF
jgi:hypothetical protein